MNKIIKYPKRTVPAILTLIVGILTIIFLACPTINQALGSTIYEQSGVRTINFGFNTLISLSSVVVILLLIFAAGCIVLGFIGYLHGEGYVRSKKFEFLSTLFFSILVCSGLILHILYWSFITTGLAGSIINVMWPPMVSTIVIIAMLGLVVSYLVTYYLDKKNNRLEGYKLHETFIEELPKEEPIKELKKTSKKSKP